MKKIYLAKKDPAMPADGSNWIVMNSYDFAMFMKTPEGQKRKNNFGQLDACSRNEYIIVAECGSESAKEWRSSKDEHDYLVNVEKEMGFTVFSYNTQETSEDDMSGEELIVDKNCDVEQEVLRKIEYEELYKALSLLSDDDKNLLVCLFLHQKPMTEREYAKEYGEKQTSVNYRKARALERLKKILEN